MIVRQDDTLVCEDCYADETEPREAHRDAFQKVDAGICEQCGAIQELHIDGWILGSDGSRQLRLMPAFHLT